VSNIKNGASKKKASFSDGGAGDIIETASKKSCKLIAKSG